MKKLFILNFLFLILHCAIAQTPAPAQTKSILLMNGIAHLGNGKVIENSAIGFKDGKLNLVADATAIKINGSAFDTIINIPGKHVYPGIIAPNSPLGLIEIEAVRATNDFDEVGLINPEVRTQIAFNTDSKIIPTVRFNGVLIVQAAPRRGMLSGTSSVFMLDGWNWEDALLKADDGVHLNFPRLPIEKSNSDTGNANRKLQYVNQINELKKFFLDAKAYNEADAHEEKNLRFESMKGIFNGSKRLFINADHVKDLVAAINFIKENGIKSPVITGGMDAWMLTAMLKENNIPVMVSRIHDLPMRPGDDIDMPFKLPSLLQKAGILFCLQNEGDMAAIHTRNIPFYAGTAAAYGLSKEEALMSVTLNAAKILGIDNLVGSLENNKDATLFISTGDAFDMKTNNVEMAFIKGKKLDLNNDQKTLYEKYKKKYALR
ncbi:MAG: amidohydrolase family protein [Bacteroidetes bacterium]|nr:amidohydrolase family protein [Bacteroidota bacterium]